MDKLEKQLNEIKELLEKAPVMASPRPPKPPKAQAAQKPEAPQAPGIGPASKKDPNKVAQQLKNPDMAIKPVSREVKEILILKKNGQWSLDKVFPVPSSP